MNQTLKTAVLSLFQKASPALSAAAILMYHSVGENKAFFTVSSEAFSAQMAYLKEKKFKVVFLSELVKMIVEKKDISGCVAITFDDGYRDFLQNAVPILHRYGFPSSVFLISDMLGRSYVTSDGISLPLMTKEEAVQIQQKSSVEYLPHTAQHVQLDRVAHDDALQEIDISKKHIADMFGGPADIFAYPKGKYTLAIVEYLSTRGFRAAVTVKEGFATPKSDLFLLPRLSVDSGTTLSQFKAKLSDGYASYLSFRHFFQ